MEEKESTVSGSLGNSDTDSPTVPVSSMMMPQVMNMNMGMMTMERSIDGPGPAGVVVGAAETTGSGGGAMGSGAGGGGGGGGGGGVDSSGRKKRGRPRKYDADGNLRLPYPIMSPPPGFSLSPSPPEYSSKRGRGRPPGSGNWQLLASFGELFANTAGGDFTPHVITVNTGEDVAGKILSLSQKGPRGICILSANGAVSNVTLRQPGSAGGILTYEGRFEILSLTGSFTVTDHGGVKSRTGGLSVSLAGPDGRVIGGGLAGILVAASPIQIVVGSFMPNGYKVHKRKHHREPPMSSAVQGAPFTITAAQPISQAKPDSESAYITPASPPLGQSCGEPDSNIITNSQQMPNLMSSHGAVWNGSETTSIQRPSPDINVSVPSE